MLIECQLMKCNRITHKFFIYWENVENNEYIVIVFVQEYHELSVIL